MGVLPHLTFPPILQFDANAISGWFTKKTEESHVSNVIDLLFNLSFFVYYGSIIPWSQMNSPVLTIVPWRLVVIAILILLFRRIPIMLAFKPIIPDIRSWREALFCGHFGPIGVGAIFISILARAELETGTTIPLATLPTDPSTPNYILIQAIWPIVSFLILSSVPPFLFHTF
jgi:sodium/hydrogen antiporter